MSTMHPSGQSLIAKKNKAETGTDDTVLNSTITVPSDQFGIVYNLWVSCNVGSTADIDALNASIGVQIAFGGSVAWKVFVHPRVESTVSTPDQIDLGPWHFAFHDGGIYSGVAGEDIVVQVGAFGTGIQARVAYQYSGD